MIVDADGNEVAVVPNVMFHQLTVSYSGGGNEEDEGEDEAGDVNAA